MKKARKKANVQNKVKSVGVSTLDTNELIPSNLPLTVDETTEDTPHKEPTLTKVGGRTRDAMLQEIALMSDEDKIACEKLMARLQEKQIVSDGTTRASQKLDTEKMIKFRKDFLKLCEDSCDGFEINKRGGKKFFFTDTDGNKRVIRIYMKTEKEVVAEIEDAVKLAHDEAITSIEVEA